MIWFRRVERETFLERNVADLGLAFCRPKEPLQEQEEERFATLKDTFSGC